MLVVAEIAVVSAWWQPLSRGSVLILALAIVAGFSVLEDIVPLKQSIASTFGGMSYSLYLMAFPLLLTAVLTADLAELDRRAFQSFSAQLRRPSPLSRSDPLCREPPICASWP